MKRLLAILAFLQIASCHQPPGRFSEFEKLSGINDYILQRVLEGKQHSIDSLISEMTPEQVDGISEIDLMDPDFTIDLANISKFKNLTNLRIRLNKFPIDLNEISKLTKLEYLTLINVRISTEAFSKPWNLVAINIIASELDSSLSLSGCQKLVYFGLEESPSEINKIKDFPKSIKTVSLRRNSISTLNEIPKSFSKVKKLDLSNNNLSNLDGLMEFVNLEEIYVGSNPLIDRSKYSENRSAQENNGINPRIIFSSLSGETD